MGIGGIFYRLLWDTSIKMFDEHTSRFTVNREAIQSFSINSLIASH